MTTVSLEMNESQVLELVKQLSPEGKQSVFEMLIADSARWEALTDYGLERMRKLAASRGIVWDGLSDEQAEQLIDQILHET